MRGFQEARDAKPPVANGHKVEAPVGVLGDLPDLGDAANLVDDDLGGRDA